MITHKYDSTFVTLLITRAIYSAVSVSFFHYERLTGDATLYLSIAEKYIRHDFSNAIRGVFASLGPGSLHDTLEKGDPIFFEGFFEPPNKTAFVIYEDPSYARKKTWSPLESRGHFEHFINNILKNIVEGMRIYDSCSRLSLAIITIYVLFIICIVHIRSTS